MKDIALFCEGFGARTVVGRRALVRIARCTSTDRICALMVRLLVAREWSIVFGVIWLVVWLFMFIIFKKTTAKITQFV